MGELRFLIPILALSIPVLAIVFAGLARLARIKAESQQGLSGEVLDRIQELESDVQDLRQQLSEAHERLDFAERLLAKPQDRAAN